MGKIFLILIDAYSKWPEVKIVNDQSSSMVINKLDEIFAEQGLPDTIVSDNGRAFASEEIAKYFKQNGIRHILVPPYHPASNGQAERTVQTIKLKLKKMTHLPWSTRLQKILYGLRTTPSSVTGKTPAELLNNRRFRTKFDRLHPLSIPEKEAKDIQENETKRVREFREGETVCFRNYRSGPRWLEGTIVKRIGVLRYKIKRENKIFIRHVNQMLGFTENVEIEDTHNGTMGRSTSINGETSHKEPQQEEEGREDEAFGTLRIPPPSQWAEIIGVKGSEECVVMDPDDMVPRMESKNNKRPRSSESPPSKTSSKKMAFQDDGSDIESGSGSDEL